MMAGFHAIATVYSGSSSSYQPFYLARQGVGGTLSTAFYGTSLNSRYGQCLAWANDASWLAIGRSQATYLYVLETDTLTTISLGVSPTGAVWDMAVSPDGTMLAVASGSTLYVYDTTTWLASTLSPGGTIKRLKFSPDGSMLAVGMSASPWLRVYDTASWSVLYTSGNVAVNDMAFSPSGAELAVCFDGTSAVGYVLRVETATWTAGAITQRDSNAIAYSPDGSMVAVAGDNTSYGAYFRVWSIDPDTGAWSIAFTDNSRAQGKAIAFSPDGAYIGVGFTSYVVVYSTADFSEVYSYNIGGSTTTAVAFSPDSTVFAWTTSYASQYPRFVDLTTLTLGTCGVYGAHNGLAFSPVPIGGEISNESTDPVRDASGLPVARQVWLMNRNTGSRITYAISNADTGRYAFHVPNKGVPRMVIFQADNDMENSAVIDWVYPE